MEEHVIKGFTAFPRCLHEDAQVFAESFLPDHLLEILGAQGLLRAALAGLLRETQTPSLFTFRPIYAWAYASVQFRLPAPIATIGPIASIGAIATILLKLSSHSAFFHDRTVSDRSTR